MIRERLREFEESGIDQVIGVGPVGRIPHELMCSSFWWFSKEVLPEFKERERANSRKQAERRARISEKAMARKPKQEERSVTTVIPSAGRH
jgi:hypothetical protein